jgi:tetratricopeptide (TPR) repeat protein
MLRYAQDLAGVVQAYRYFLLTKPGTDVERVVLTEMAEMLMKVGEKSVGEPRKKCFEEAKEIATKIQWGGVDEAFGKTVVMLAHIQLIEGNKADARKIITDYMPMLQQIDDMLKAEPDGARRSPMAQCRYMLGQMGEQEIRDLVAADPVMNREKIIELAKQTLSHYYTVLIKYPSNSWASEAGQRGDGLATWLSERGFQVGKLPKEKLVAIVDVLLKEARMLFQQQDYKGAVEKYRAVLNTFPEINGAVPALGDMTRSYIQLKDFYAADALTGYLGERYSAATPELMEEAGNMLLAAAAEYESIGDKTKAAAINELFFEKFPTHKRAAIVVFREGESRFRAENYGEALAYYLQVMEKFPKDRVFVDALSRASYCHIMLGAYSNAVPLLQKHIEIVPPSSAQIASRLRLADCWWKADATESSLKEYSGVVKLLTEEGDVYGSTPEEKGKNKKHLETAMFWKAFCYSRLKTPADKVPQFQGKAIEGFKLFLDQYPKSEMAAPALSVVGTLYFLQGKPDEAEKAYSRLASDFPDTEQAKNVTFALAKSLMDLGQMEKAVTVYEKMLADPAKFLPGQFLQAAITLADAKQNEAAIKFYRQAAKEVGQRAIWEPAMIGLANTFAKMNNWAEVVKVVEELLAKYPNSGFTVEANFLLCRAYSEVAVKETDGVKKQAAFAQAAAAINQARKFIKDSGLSARADYETAHLQTMEGKKSDAMASYARIILLLSPNDAKVAPWYELAVEEGLPLLMEMKQYGEVVDGGEAYLKAFPKGRLVNQVRQWRDQAKVKMITAQPASRAGTK